MEEVLIWCTCFATAAPKIIKVDPDSVFFPSWGLSHGSANWQGLWIGLCRSGWNSNWHGIAFILVVFWVQDRIDELNHSWPAEFALSDSNLWPRTAETSHWKTLTVSWLKRSEEDCWSILALIHGGTSICHTVCCTLNMRVAFTCQVHWIKPGCSHLQEIRAGTNSKLLLTTSQTLRRHQTSKPWWAKKI